MLPAHSEHQITRTLKKLVSSLFTELVLSAVYFPGNKVSSRS